MAKITLKNLSHSYLSKQTEDEDWALKDVNIDILKNFLIILNPFAPHITEEIFEKLNIHGQGPITNQQWPVFNDSLLVAEKMTVAVQINGKTRGTVELDNDLDQEDIVKYILNDADLKKYLKGVVIIKEIYIPNRLVNFVVK